MFSAELIGALRRHPIWQHASDHGLRRLISGATERRFGAGDLILSLGEPANTIYLLLDGVVRVFHPDPKSKREVTVRVYWAPASFGDGEANIKVAHAVSTNALTPVRLLTIDAMHYFKMMQTEPSACFRQYWDTACRFGIAIQAEHSANIEDLEARVISLLSSYARTFGKKTTSGWIISLPLTQDSVAMQVGSNRRSLVRVLARLKAKGLVRRAGHRFLIPDLNSLLKISRGTQTPFCHSSGIPWAESGGPRP